MSIQEAVYYIYEAKKMSEVSPGVGPLTDMAVTWKSDRPGYGKIKMIGPFYMTRLENEYKRFGPQPYEPSGWPSIIEEFPTTDQLSPPSTTGDPSLPQPSPELLEGSDES
jgi:hypothetical protein